MDKNSIVQEINKNKKISLSNFDLMKLVDGKAKVVTYDNLYKYKNLDHLLYPYDAVFLLYLFKPKYGHWVALTKRNNVVEYCDSYGKPPDEVLEHIPKLFAKKSHQDYPYLSKLLWESPYNIEYNDYNFQKHGNDIRTCGRFAALRVIFKHLTLNKFAKLFFSPYSDEIATYFTM